MSKNIKLARKRMKLTVFQVAERADFVSTTLYQIENGNSSVANYMHSETSICNHSVIIMLN